MLDIIAGAAAAVLSGLGVGSGGILVIYLTLLGGRGQLEAQGINLLFFLFSSGSAMLVHFAKRKIYTGAVLTLALSGLLGALVGCTLSGVLEAETVRKIFGVMLVVTGMISVYPRKKNHQRNKTHVHT